MFIYIFVIFIFIYSFNCIRFFSSKLLGYECHLKLRFNYIKQVTPLVCIYNFFLKQLQKIFFYHVASKWFLFEKTFNSNFRLLFFFIYNYILNFLYTKIDRTSLFRGKKGHSLPNRKPVPRRDEISLYTEAEQCVAPTGSNIGSDLISSYRWLIKCFASRQFAAWTGGYPVAYLTRHPRFANVNSYCLDLAKRHGDVDAAFFYPVNLVDQFRLILVCSVLVRLTFVCWDTSSDCDSVRSLVTVSFCVSNAFCKNTSFFCFDRFLSGTLFL